MNVKVLQTPARWAGHIAPTLRLNKKDQAGTCLGCLQLRQDGSLPASRPRRSASPTWIRAFIYLTRWDSPTSAFAGLIPPFIWLTTLGNAAHLSSQAFTMLGYQGVVKTRDGILSLIQPISSCCHKTNYLFSGQITFSWSWLFSSLRTSRLCLCTHFFSL